MSPSNMSIQPAATDAEGRIVRPPMKQENHPEHNMPESEHDGRYLGPGTNAIDDALYDIQSQKYQDMMDRNKK